MIRRGHIPSRPSLVLALGGLAVAGFLGWALPRAMTAPDPFSVGLSLIADGRAAEAVHLFHDPDWRGVAEYRAGRYRRALAELFHNESVTNLYNMGTAYARLHTWAGARAAYEKVLTLDPAHEDARHNLDLVLRAEAAERALAEAARAGTKRLGRWEDGTREQEDPGAAGEDQPDAETPRVQNPELASGETAPTERRSGAGGQSATPGSPGEQQQARDAGAGAARAEPGDAEVEAEAPARASRAAPRAESAAEAETLLRAITDDPERVLAARLRLIHRRRLEEAGPDRKSVV